MVHLKTSKSAVIPVQICRFKIRFGLYYFKFDSSAPLNLPNRFLAVPACHCNPFLGPSFKQPTKNNVHRPFTLFSLSLSLSTYRYHSHKSPPCRRCASEPFHYFTTSPLHSLTTPPPPRPPYLTPCHNTGGIKTVALIHTDVTTHRD